MGRSAVAGRRIGTGMLVIATVIATVTATVTVTVPVAKGVGSVGSSGSAAGSDVCKTATAVGRTPAA